MSNNFDLSYFKSNHFMMTALLFFACAFAVMLVQAAPAGTTTMFDTAKTEVDNSFGVIAAMIILGSTVAGGIFAWMKGAWIYAGMGVAVGFLLVIAKNVATGAGFSALI